MGQRPADVYRPPRTNAAAAHQPAGAAGLRQSPSGQRNLPAAAGLHRYRPAGATADRAHRPASRPAPAAAAGDLRGGHRPAVALSRCAAPGPVAGGQGFPGVAGADGRHAQPGTLRLSLTFNPLHARQKAASGELPTDSSSFGFTAGTLGNVHFVTIPANARAVAGAKVVANFLLSPEAQLRKADAAVWGDPSVLDPQRLPDGQRQALAAALPQDLPPVLAEPHAAWVDALEQEWLRRYGTH